MASPASTRSHSAVFRLAADVACASASNRVAKSWLQTLYSAELPQKNSLRIPAIVGVCASTCEQLTHTVIEPRCGALGISKGRKKGSDAARQCLDIVASLPSAGPPRARRSCKMSSLAPGETGHKHTPSTGGLFSSNAQNGFSATRMLLRVVVASHCRFVTTHRQHEGVGIKACRRTSAAGTRRASLHVWLQVGVQLHKIRKASPLRSMPIHHATGLGWFYG